MSRQRFGAGEDQSLAVQYQTCFRPQDPTAAKPF
ncbi:hypothetical protein DSM3645_26574 [Blastopirellula marina DSM 3645]|uniref:Uncharacterized protein n=1 Tax=Blastopirellula marina DSM 3645 TaxID=314230 RepID=A3ZY45_9BACT|nr:hypothetical protein DSM3645_26574 [Blastopirellula marina DSM 3645]